MELFYGSERIVEKPLLAKGRLHNDYGQGFYCTGSAELAAEWACKNHHDGFVNSYEFDAAGLSVLDLLDGSFSVLHWIALLLANRVFSLQEAPAREAREFILENYLIDLSEFDVVVGYRADDSYFSYAESFVNNALPVRLLARALQLGGLGEQTVLVSERAFGNLTFAGATRVEQDDYYPRYKQRDREARREYRDAIAHSGSLVDDLFVFDIMRRGGIGDGYRIRRDVS